MRSADGKGDLMDAKSSEELLRYLRRYDTQTRQSVKVLSLDRINPIYESTASSDSAAEAALAQSGGVGGVDQPFIESMLAKERAAKLLLEEECGGDDLGGVTPPSPRVQPSSGAVPASFKCLKLGAIPACPEDMNLTHELLNKLVILRLNGGLGTSMGCKGPKSAIEVRNNLSFLDMAVRQVEFLNTKHGVDVPLVLMNSFNTDEETKRVLSRYMERHVTIKTFRQSQFPRIGKATLQPLPAGRLTPETADRWYPPGHGDVYTSLARCGLLRELIDKGKEYIFISNIDNLGATVDLSILYHLMENDVKFCMEVTHREKQDLLGGTLVEHNGRPLLLEASGIDKVLGETLRRDARYDKFNTNNLWLNLRDLQAMVSVSKSLELPVILREKRIKDPSGDGEVACLSFETVAGSAISLFDNSLVVVVPRARFLPVKTTDDLFAVQSDLFTVRHGTLQLSEQRHMLPAVPTVKLGPCFRTVEEYNKRLPFGVPDIIELEHLTVNGDVHFRNHVKLQGTVIIVAEGGQHIDICSGSVIRDKVITGHLTITPH